MKTVVLIGDSIRLGYQDKVRKMLGDNVRVLSPNENCRYTKYTLWGMFDWMAQWGNPDVDVIHWNTGIWDMHLCTADGKRFTPIEEYVEYSHRIAIQMAAYTKNLIWATCTPATKAIEDKMPTDYLQHSEPNVRNVWLTGFYEDWMKDLVLYNEAAKAVMLQHDVRINDLYSLIIKDTDRYICEDGIHLTDEGYEVAAAAVVAEIKKFL